MENPEKKYDEIEDEPRLQEVRDALDGLKWKKNREIHRGENEEHSENENEPRRRQK